MMNVLNGMSGQWRGLCGASAGLDAIFVTLGIGGGRRSDQAAMDRVARMGYVDGARQGRGMVRLR